MAYTLLEGKKDNHQFYPPMGPASKPRKICPLL